MDYPVQCALIQTICPYLPHLAYVDDDATGYGVCVDPNSVHCSLFNGKFITFNRRNCIWMSGQDLERRGRRICIQEAVGRLTS